MNSHSNTLLGAATGRHMKDEIQTRFNVSEPGFDVHYHQMSGHYYYAFSLLKASKKI